MPSDDGALLERVDRLNAWVLTDLPKLNRNILSHQCPPGQLGAELARSVLVGLPAPESLPVRQAQQMVVLVGMIGASLGRHYQELDSHHRATPERAFDPYLVGSEAVPFRAYFERLAAQTGTGHCSRDTYTSLTKWNLPTTEVWWAGERVAVLTGVFDDGLVRTYSGTAEERRFFELVKMSESIELAINTALMPISDSTLDMSGPGALERVRLAIVLLEQLRHLNVNFAALSAEEGLRADFFMDVFRQYAVHWTVDDIPPSGAVDPEWIARDCLLGVRVPGFEAHTRLVFPVLLDTERDLLTRLMDRPSLPEIALESLGLDALTLAEMSPAQLRETVSRHPVLAALCQLLAAHARMSGVHLKIAKKYLFAPQRQREMAGMGDPTVVPNRLGTTGIDEMYLAELTRARNQHVLTCLRTLGGSELDSLAGLDRVRAASAGLGSLIRFTGPGTGQTPPVAWLTRPANRERAGTRGRSPAQPQKPALQEAGDDNRITP
jgi:hypothetical protein